MKKNHCCQYCGRFFGMKNRPKGISIDIVLSESNWTQSPATDYFNLLNEICPGCFKNAKAIIDDFIKKYRRFIEDGTKNDGTKRF